jgi:hypothetical protein
MAAGEDFQRHQFHDFIPNQRPSSALCAPKPQRDERGLFAAEVPTYAEERGLNIREEGSDSYRQVTHREMKRAARRGKQPLDWVEDVINQPTAPWTKEALFRPTLTEEDNADFFDRVSQIVCKQVKDRFQQAMLRRKQLAAKGMLGDRSNLVRVHTRFKCDCREIDLEAVAKSVLAAMQDDKQNNNEQSDKGVNRLFRGGVHYSALSKKPTLGGTPAQKLLQEDVVWDWTRLFPDGKFWGESGPKVRRWVKWAYNVIESVPVFYRCSHQQKLALVLKMQVRRCIHSHTHSLAHSHTHTRTHSHTHTPHTHCSA